MKIQGLTVAGMKQTLCDIYESASNINILGSATRPTAAAAQGLQRAAERAICRCLISESILQ